MSQQNHSLAKRWRIGFKVETTEIRDFHRTQIRVAPVRFFIVLEWVLKFAQKVEINKIGAGQPLSVY